RVAKQIAGTIGTEVARHLRPREPRLGTEVPAERIGTEVARNLRPREPRLGTEVPSDLRPEALDALARPNDADLDEFRRGIDPLASTGKLGALLAQFPPSFK